MKKYFLIFFPLFLVNIVKGQIYVDPAVAGATASHSVIMNNALKQTNDKLTLIERGQLAVMGELSIVNNMQAKIFTGLSEISSILSNLNSVNEIVRIGRGITGDINGAMEVARKNPAYLLFVESQIEEFNKRANKLKAEVIAFALKGGGDNLMDSGERARMLNVIYTDLLIIRSITYGMYRSMYYAQLNGFWFSVNPYRNYINQDRRIMEDIIRKRQYLK